MSSEPQKSRIHPRQKTNIISRLLFCWQLPVILKGHRQQLTENDVYDPLKEQQARYLGNKLEKAWFQEVSDHGEDASLCRALLKVFGTELALYGVLVTIIELIIRMAPPIFLWNLLVVYTTGEPAVSRNQIILWTALMVAAIFSRILTIQNYWFGMEYLGVKMRVACTSLIYRKCLTLSQDSLNNFTVAQIVNFLAADVTRFNCGLIRYVHYLWLLPFGVALILYLLNLFLGYTALAGIIFVVLYWPIQVLSCRLISTFRMKVVEKTDQRVRVINEMIKGIKVIKMLAWEKLFIKLSESYRESEMKKVKTSLFPYAANASAMCFVTRVPSFICVLVHVLTGHAVTAQYFFTVHLFYDVIRHIVFLFMPWGTICVGELITSIRRIEKLLKCKDVRSVCGHDEKNISLTKIKDRRHILSDVTLTVKKKLVALIGPVGCGKSTLLRVILGEIPILEGTLQVGGTLSYASQEPWIFGGTVQDNILFGEEFDEKKYNEVVKVCALERDFCVLPNGDLTYVGDFGSMLSGGQKSRINLARAVYKDADFYLLDDPLSAVDVQVGKTIFNECIKKYLGNKSVVLVTHQLQYLDKVDEIHFLENGRIADSGSYDYLKDKELFKTLRINRNECDVQEIASRSLERKKPRKSTTLTEVEEAIKVGAVAKTAYGGYIKAGGTCFAVVIFSLALFMSFIMHGIDYFLSIWVTVVTMKDTSFYFLYIYAALILLLLFLSVVVYCCIIKFCCNAAKQLHSKMLHKVVYTNLSFFTKRTSGHILNRFSADLNQIDRYLSTTLTDAFIITFVCSFSIALVAVVNVWSLLPLTVLLIISFYVRRVYLSTSRSFKRIEANCRSPVFSHLTTTLQGLEIIRAQNASEAQKIQFEKHVDKQTSACYLQLACDSAFGFWLDIFSAIYFAISVLSLILRDSGASGGQLGLAIEMAIFVVGTMQFGMKQFAEMENQMVSVERVMEYSEIPIEEESPTVFTKEWPTNGKIEAKDVSLRYAPQNPMVLKELTFSVNSSEKIGIVGRTGAGKSSLISVVFRLFEFEGDVLVDDVSTRTIPLSTLRSKISIIPQDPVLFSCSIRANLDPFDEFQDSQLWDALDDVEMRPVISALPSGLFSKLSEGGVNLSVGQKQLLCLARAILKMNKILILDEATANVDLKTDELIRGVMRNKFRECTILTIAHRIHTVIDSDKILVMDNGRVLEFDAPSKLLEDKNGAFFKLFHASAHVI